MSSLPVPKSGFAFSSAAAEGPPRPRLRPALRERRRDRPDLLLGQGDHHRGPGLGAARPARRDREVDLRGRPPHDLPARPLPVRARERLAPVPLDVSPLAPFYNSEQVSQRYVEVSRGNYAVPADGRARARHLRADRAAPAGGLRPADGAADAAGRRSATSASSRAARGATAATRFCGLGQEARAGDRALRAAGRDVLVPVPHGLGRHALPLLAPLRDDGRAGRAARGRRADGRGGPPPRPALRDGPPGSDPARGDARVRRVPRAAPGARRLAGVPPRVRRRASAAASRGWSTGRPTTRRSWPPPCARSSASRAPRSPTTTRSGWSSTRRRTAPRRDADADDPRQALARPLPSVLHVPQEALAHGRQPGPAPPHDAGLAARPCRRTSPTSPTTSSRCSSATSPEAAALYRETMEETWAGDRRAARARRLRRVRGVPAAQRRRHPLHRVGRPAEPPPQVRHAPLLQRAGGDLARLPRRGAADPRGQSAHRPVAAAALHAAPPRRGAARSAPRASASAASSCGRWIRASTRGSCSRSGRILCCDLLEALSGARPARSSVSPEPRPAVDV